MKIEVFAIFYFLGGFIMDFMKEIEQYSIDDLELILSTQKDLYTDDEFSCIKKLLRQKKDELRQRQLKNLPKEIPCPKCDGINLFQLDKCKFCGYTLDKSKYYKAVLSELSEDVELKNNKKYIFEYTISFLIPLVGFILGAIQLSKNDDEERSKGKTCIVLGIISVIISIFIYNIYLQYN